MKIQKQYIIIFIISLIIFILANILTANYSATIGDETFYMFQAKNILQGKFLWFEDTSSALFPIILSPFSYSLPLARIFLSVLTALTATLLFIYAKNQFSKKVAIFSLIIFLAHPQVLKMSFSLLTEIPFLLLTFIYLLYYEKISIPTVKKFQILLLGVIFGLALLTKHAAIVLPAALFITTLASSVSSKEKKKTIFLLITTSVIGLLLFLIWPSLAGYNILQDKITRPDTFFRNMALNSIPSYFLPSFLGLLILSLLFGKYKSKNYFFLINFVIIYLFIMLTFINFFFVRYFFVTLPFLSIIIGIGLTKIYNKKQYIAIILLAIFLIHAAISLPILKQEYNNHYYFNKPNCENLKSFTSDCSPYNLEIPYFSQPDNSICSYATTFTTQEQIASIIISYADDNAEIYLDNQNIGQANTWEEATIPVTLNPGTHTFKAIIINGNNIGGLGQVLTCK